VAVKIRLKRMGKIRALYYRIVVADSRTKRDGRVIEEIGKYHPTENPSIIEVNSDRAQYWLGVGAQPTEQVAALLKLTGDWGMFKGEKGAKSTVQVAEPKAVFQADTKKKPVLRPKVVKPVQEAPAEAPVAQEAPVADAAPAEDSAPAEAVVAETPAEEALAADGVATEEVAADEVVAETPAEQALAADEVATDEVVAEAPAEEAPVEEAPVEEAPADEAAPEETK